MTISIDQIFEMLNYNNDEETQKQGVNEARKINSYFVFIQPCDALNSWENCALIIAEKEDIILETYLFQLFKWISDLNVPGAITIYKRLKKIPVSSEFTSTFSCIIKYASLSCDKTWLNNLASFLENKELVSQLNKERVEILSKYYIGPII